MSKRTTLTIALQGDAGEYFAPTAFDSQIGKTIPVVLEDGSDAQGTVVAARVADDGRSCELTIDTPVNPA